MFRCLVPGCGYSDVFWEGDARRRILMGGRDCAVRDSLVGRWGCIGVLVRIGPGFARTELTPNILEYPRGEAHF